MAWKPNPIMDGVQEDLSRLVYSFISPGETTFSRFVNIWNSHNFCYIYCGRVMVKEVKHFAREILIMAKQLCFSKNSPRERIAGVFILYSLYYIQPLKVPVRIRIEKDELKELIEFVNGHQSKEVKYCFFKLFVDHAFDYVFSANLYSLEKIREREAEKRHTKTVATKAKLNNKEVVERLWKIIDFDQVKWLQIESQYNNLKTYINRLGDQSNFEMTEFLKPLLTIQEQYQETDKTDSLPKPSVLKSDNRKRRVKAASAVLTRDTSSSEEDVGVGGSGSMPRINSMNDTDDDSADDPLLM